MPRRLILLAALAAAGCGGGDDEATTARTAAEATHPAQTRTEDQRATDATPAPGETPAVVAREKRALERAGFDVRESSAAGVDGAEGGLEAPLKGGGDLTVIAFETRDSAERHAEQFRELAAQHPGSVRIAIRDTTLFLGIAEPPERLSRASFDAAVSAAAGAG